MRKGFSEAMGLAVITFFVVALVANLGMERVASLESRIALNTVPLAAERVEIGVYTMDAVEEGELEMTMRSEYNLSRENGKQYLLYKHDSYIPSQDEVRKTEIDPPVDFRIAKEGKSDKICVEKRSTIRVRPGEC